MRNAVAARGIPLLKLIAAAGENGLMLTQAEAHMAIADGYAVADTSVTDGDTAKVTLTPAGTAKIAPKASVVFDIDDDVPMPTAKKKGGGKKGSKYPFDKLNVGQSFHVSATAENPNPETALASSLTGARRQFAKPVLNEDGSPKTETVTVNTYAVDAKGKRVKDANNKWVVTGTASVTRNVTEQERDFVVAVVGADDPKGAGARVYRNK